MTLRPIATAPKTGKFILLFGDSGYVTTPMRCEVGRWESHAGRWVTYDNSNFTESGSEPTHWMPLPEPPEDPHEIRDKQIDELRGLDKTEKQILKAEMREAMRLPPENHNYRRAELMFGFILKLGRPLTK